MFKNALLLTVSLSFLSASCAGAQTESSLNLVPWPKKVQLGSGSLSLTQGSRIVTDSDALMPLANVLSEEVFLVTGNRLATAKGQAAAGDMALELAKDLKGEAHKVVVTDNVTVQGGNYVGVAMGTATVLQLLQQKDGKVTLPRVTVEDWPYPEYTGMMMDVARQFNSIESLKQSVILAHLYKMKYFHLHLTDDQLFTFPSTKYPKLKGVYKLEELKDLVRFADERGVTIVPEFEMPGHSSALAGAYREIFGDTQGCVIDFINPKAIPMLSDIVDEMCQVFKSSPYFHIGSDESNFALFETWPDVIADRAKNHRNTPMQHAWLINEMNKVAKKNGKKLIVWEGFESTDVDKDVIVMEWDGRFFSPIPITQAGYRIINVPWEPSAGWTARANYEWNMWLVGSQERKPDQLPRTAPVIGGQMVLWECPGEVGLPVLRAKAVPRHERVHSPDAGKTYEDFDRRFAATDQVLDLLVHRFAVKTEGLTNHGDNGFDKSLTITLIPSPALQGATIRYTLDNTWPTNASTAYAGLIHVTSNTSFKAQAFDAEGKPIGYPRWTTYNYKPLTGSASKLLPKEIQHENRYADPMTVTLKSAVKGEVRYTLDGREPTMKSAVYGGPIKVQQGSMAVRAALFVDGKKQGDEWRQDYIWVDYEKNIATGKPVSWTDPPKWVTDSAANDGFVDRNNHWGQRAPGSLTIDLEKAVKLGEIDLYTWFGDGRHYQYFIEVSEDGKSWQKVADGSGNTQVATEKGYRHKFAPTDARYVRITMLKNSANPAVHIVEVRAYEAK